jgi:hypothetical protein
MSDTLNMDEEGLLLEQIVRNKLEIERLQAENDTYVQYFKDRPDAYPTGTKKEIGKFYVKVSTNQRIDDALARKNLKVAEYNKLTKKVIDTTLARKILAEDQLAKITKVFENKIEVGLR